MVTGSKIASGEGASTSPIPPKPRPTPKPQPEPQAGMLTAGDYDDTLNPELYKTYLDKMLQGELSGKELPFVDAANRIEVLVTDRLGKPVPFANVAILDRKDGVVASARTGAKGKVYFYPAFDDLKGAETLVARMDKGRRVGSAIRDKDGEWLDQVTLSFDRDAAAATKLDLLLTIDATGSMADEMRYLQTELRSIVDSLEAKLGKVDLHTGLIVYRDKGDAYVVREFDFTDNLDQYLTDLGAQKADGGGDFPEAMHDAMKAGEALSWRDDAIKVNFLVADAPPHDADIMTTWQSAEFYRREGVHVVPLAASGVDKTAEFLMRAMSQLTGGRYLFLTDDSGIGNTHAEPTVDCYVVTRLDTLISRVLIDLYSGNRVEPEGDEVIRLVGDYKLGRCMVPEKGSKD